MTRPLLLILNLWMPAKADYDVAAKKFPNNSTVFYSRGLFFRELKNNKDALTEFDKAIELNPKDLESYHYRAIVKDDLKDEKGACADITKAKELGFIDKENLKGKMCGK